jgi:hypothetical protein
MTTSHPTTTIKLSDDGTSGEIVALPFDDPAVHRYLSAAEVDADRESRATDALSIGARTLELAAGSAQVGHIDEALRRSDERCGTLLDEMRAGCDEIFTKSLDGLAESLEADDGPFADLLAQFDPATDGNVIDAIKSTITATAKSVVKDATEALSDDTRRLHKDLTEAMQSIQVLMAAETARQAEAGRGTAKGLDFEARVEALLGELVSVTGDELEDVSREAGLGGNKKGDHVIRVAGGCRIAVEEKASGKYSPAKARKELEPAMANRGARLGILIVDDESKVDGHQPFQLVDDDKVIVVADRQALLLIYRFMRARALHLAQLDRSADGDEAVAVLREVEGEITAAREALKNIAEIRTGHTQAINGVEKARGWLDQLEADLIGSLDRIEQQVSEVLDAAEDESPLAA